MGIFEHNLPHLAATIRGRCNVFIEKRLHEEGVLALVPSHGSILAALYEHGPQAMSHLSALIKRDKSTVTVLVRKLEQLGYIERTEGSTDSRVIMVSLTAKGTQFQPVFEKISSELYQKLWEGVSPEERTCLCEKLKSIINRL